MMRRSATSSSILTAATLDDLPLWSAPFGLMLLDAVPYRKGQRFLDIGCGTGFPLLELAGRLEGAEGFGVDPWRDMCDVTRRKCRAKNIRNVTILCRNAESLPFPDRSFDLIVSNNGLNNVADLDAVLHECRRTLKPSGALVATINLPGTMREFYTVFRRVMKRHGISDADRRVAEHIRKKRMRAEEFIDKLRKHGFKVTQRREDRFLLRYSSGSAFLDHPFVRLAFLPAWRDLLPGDKRRSIVSDCRDELNARANPMISLTIPILCVKAIPTLS